MSKDMYVLIFRDEEQGDAVIAVAHDVDTLMTHAVTVDAESAEEEDRAPVDDLQWAQELEGSEFWISRNIFPTFENFYRIQPITVV